MLLPFNLYNKNVFLLYNDTLNISKNIIVFCNTNKSKIKNFKWYSLNNINNLELPTLMKVIINKSLKDRALN